jgi:magnesium-transporting ATPase (P-type)
MFIVFFGSLMLSDSPLNAVQMLWVNLIMDTLAALALATEPPDDSILTRQPQPSSKSIVTEIMWRNVHGHAIYQMITLIVIIFCAQGGLVETYDVKCLGDVDEKTNKCKTGGLNPFFAADLYHQLETEKYWTEVGKEAGNDQPAAYDKDAWPRYQCAQLTKYHGVKDDCSTNPGAVFGKYLNKGNFEK